MGRESTEPKEPTAVAQQATAKKTAKKTKKKTTTKKKTSSENARRAAAAAGELARPHPETGSERGTENGRSSRNQRAGENARRAAAAGSSSQGRTSQAATATKASEQATQPATTSSKAEKTEETPRKKTRRGKRGGKKHKSAASRSAETQSASQPDAPPKEKPGTSDAPESGDSSQTKKKSTRRRTPKRQKKTAVSVNEEKQQKTADDRPSQVGPDKAVADAPPGSSSAKSTRGDSDVAKKEDAASGSETKQSDALEDGQEHESLHSDEASQAKLVMKRRPKRKRRGVHGRKTADEIDGQPEPSEAERKDKRPEPAKEDSAEPQDKQDKERPKSRRSGKRKKKQTKRASESKAGDTEDNSTPSAMPVIDSKTAAAAVPAKGFEMVINVTTGAECRIAILQNGRLEELFIERRSAESHVGNIYKGFVTNVEPSIQAAFVDFGQGRNGFLHISDVQPKYFRDGSNETESVGKKVPRRDRPPIQRCFRRGDEVIVQVTKEGVGTKGPTLTTYLSIPGQFVVMMPGMNRLGVSRRIEDEADRRRMRDILNELNLPDGSGFILRTAGLDRTKRDLQGDVNYLSRLSKTVEERVASTPAPCELYQESDLVIRTIRDVYTSGFERIVVDDHDTAKKARDFLRIAMPRSHGVVAEYRRDEPIFHHYKIEKEIERIYSRHVPLPSGGSIVIDTTEAMVAIDVNSGKFRNLADAEETAFKTNMEAAEEIARQLRLRDLGGLVVCDFIDMYQEKHKRAIEKALREALRKHKERARILRMSKFGLIEMTRQRQRPSIKRSIFTDCPHCNGSGLIKTPESMSLEVMRILQLLARREEVCKITMHVAPEVANLALNERRSMLHELERDTGRTIVLKPDPSFSYDQVSYDCQDDRGMPLRLEV